MNIPNALTLLRFLLIPVFAYFLYKGPGYYLLALVFFVASGITDVLDGYIARKYNMVTSLGKIADPVADKLMQVSALVVLMLQGRIHWLILVIVAVKEGLMGLGSLILYRKSHYIATANQYGKAATLIFYCAVALVILLNLKAPYSAYIIGFAVFCMLFAFVMYLFTFRNISKKGA